MRKNYNNRRGKLHLPEYGRHIQEMVDSLKDIADREERNRQAHAVIAVMGNLNPLLRDTADFTHKLWDHLYMISDFELDVDSPYPLPTRELIEAKPNKLSYSRGRIRFKHYGRYVSKMIETISKDEVSESSTSAIDNIARYMRTKSFEYNQEHPNNEVIIKDIRSMAKGSIVMDEDAISNLKSEYKNTQNAHSLKGSKNNKGAKNQQRGQNNSTQRFAKGGGTQRRKNSSNR